MSKNVSSLMILLESIPKPKSDVIFQKQRQKWLGKSLLVRLTPAKPSCISLNNSGEANFSLPIKKSSGPHCSSYSQKNCSYSTQLQKTTYRRQCGTQFVKRDAHAFQTWAEANYAVESNGNLTFDQADVRYVTFDDGFISACFAKKSI